MERLIINIKYEGKTKKLKIIKNYVVKQIIILYINTFLNSNLNYDISKFKLKLRGITIKHEDTLLSYINDINNNCVFDLVYGNIIQECMIRDVKEYQIDIKFFRKNKNYFQKDNFQNLCGLLKLCLLKEIAITDDIKNINDLPAKISKIMEILRKGKNEKTESEETIFEILNKAKDGNLINFAKYVDLLISQDEINTYLIQRLSDSKNDIKYIYNCLGKYIEYEKLFELEFKREKRNSLFEYSIISCVIIEREDIYKFEQNRQFCPNRVNRILFHGTSLDAISKILPDMFYRAESNQNGNGVYFTNQLDSCWIYGSEERNNFPDPILKRRNLNIPKVGQFFSFIASAVYYDKNGFIPVLGRGYDPKKNQVNFAVAEMTELKTVDYRKTDKRRFYGTEFVINDLDQICPFLGFKLKRDEYCIIWRDNNFSKDPVHNNQFDNVFKKHLINLYIKLIKNQKLIYIHAKILMRH